MWEEFLETGWGPWSLIAAALIVLPDARKLAKKVVKIAVKTGYSVSDAIKDVVAEAKEEAKAFNSSEEPNGSHTESARRAKNQKLDESVRRN
ncbi:MAG TPA: hypothetical protein V6C97_30405 [Oculatellaceae cyanobacterium]